ncbi:MAG: hypothetical protein GWN61_21145, partial [candidate division Zixibacteria bacterium]|nr:hypothetical protein [candidate division Zixibacteria bacterium]NIR66913.1 hypothetical protein [candidate division Zixibacteria bacterium]NIS48369.1 hypothetical protein [candidate division Zixibacteria bacterium]NIU16491.1 hypothetical protein [candidate division Zixibacteria bacterium]NIV08612.1 hypothetical protein [candidate division Zixibacteria bacterium]
MTREEKLDFLARLIMYGAKVGYDANIADVEYFIFSIGEDMGMNMQGVRTSEHIGYETGKLNAPEDEVIRKIKNQLMSMNP